MLAGGFATRQHPQIFFSPALGWKSDTSFVGLSGFEKAIPSNRFYHGVKLHISHKVILGFGSLGQQIAKLLGDINIPYLIIHTDRDQVDPLHRRGVSNLFGDTADSEVLKHAGLSRLRALVVVEPDQPCTKIILPMAISIM